MPTLSAFADEVSPNLEEALAVLKECGLKCMELRGLDGVNVMKLSGEQVKAARATLKRLGFTVGSIATPIGKVQITDAFEPQAGQMKRAIELAQALRSTHIRIFSFYLPKDGEPKQWKKQVLERMAKLVRQARGTGITVLLENEEGLYGDTIERCTEIIKALKAPYLKLAYDPCNLVIVGRKPYTDSFSLARKYLGYLHVKDWARERKEMVPAGQGDAEWKPIIGALKGMGYNGTIALEPHLSAAGQFSGFSGPELFRKAHQALTELMREAGLPIT